MTDFARGDRVITPTDEVARVLEANNGVLELVYAEALNPETAVFNLSAKVCVLWPHERPRPQPFRRRD